MTATLESAAQSPGLVARLSRLIRRIGIYRQHQRDYETLLDLDEHLLRDMGLNHDQVRLRRGMSYARYAATFHL